MSIQYTYKIFEVSLDANTSKPVNLQEQFIYVIYSSSGRGDICRAIKPPSLDENLEDIIRASAPILDWEEELNIATRAAANPSFPNTEDNRLPVTTI